MSNQANHRPQANQQNRIIATPAKSLSSGTIMVIDHEASEVHGRRMYKHIPPQFKSWVSVYHVFTAIADSVLDLPEGTNHDYAHILINNCINALYAQHEGEDAWDIAYTKWVEPSDDDEELPIDESSPILK